MPDLGGEGGHALLLRGIGQRLGEAGAQAPQGVEQAAGGRQAGGAQRYEPPPLPGGADVRGPGEQVELERRLGGQPRGQGAEDGGQGAAADGDEQARGAQGAPHEHERQVARPAARLPRAGHQPRPGPLPRRPGGGRPGAREPGAGALELGGQRRGDRQEREEEDPQHQQRDEGECVRELDEDDDAARAAVRPGGRGGVWHGLGRYGRRGRLARVPGPGRRVVPAPLAGGLRHRRAVAFAAVQVGGRRP